MTDWNAALCKAVAADDVEAAGQAIAQGANPNTTVPASFFGDATQPDMPAICGCRSFAMLQLLIGAGGDLHCTDAQGEPIGHRLLKWKQLRDRAELVPMFSGLVAAG